MSVEPAAPIAPNTCPSALDVLREHIPAESLHNIWLFFPDPWHKKRHHKRRIVRPEFLDQAAACLKPGGCLHMATDWADYADHMMRMASNDPRFTNKFGPGQFTPDPEDRPLTKFEQRGQRLAHEIRDLIFYRNTRPACDAGRQDGIVNSLQDNTGA